MNTIDFNNQKGLHVSQYTFDFMQRAYANFGSAVATVLGDYVIIDGVQEKYDERHTKYVVIKGELMPFDDSNQYPFVFVTDEKEVEQFGDSVQRDTYFRRVAKTKASSSDAIPLSAFKPLSSVSNLQTRLDLLIPRGTIVMWNGRTAPEGWTLCDGSNGTPNLRGQFIVGYDPYNVGEYDLHKTGGLKTVTLSVAQMPSHNQTGFKDTSINASDAENTSSSSYVNGSVTNGVPDGGYGLIRRSQKWKDKSRTPGSPDFNGRGFEPEIAETPVNIPYQGGNQPHENRPPYYTLAYIMKM